MPEQQTNAVRSAIDHFMKGLIARNPGEPEFHQAVQEVVESLMPVVLENARYQQEDILERITEPDRVVIFRVTWEDDEERFRVNRAWRVQFNNAIGPYKGGLRFHPSVTLGVLKFWPVQAADKPRHRHSHRQRRFVRRQSCSHRSDGLRVRLLLSPNAGRAR